MKRIIVIFLVFLMIAPLYASGGKEVTNETSVEKMYELVQKELGHKLEKYEKTIIDTTYLYYYSKCDGNWNSEIWTIAVDKSVELCQNTIAIAASKTGNFGEKLLQTLIVTTEDVFSAIGNWIENGSEEYKKRHENSGN